MSDDSGEYVDKIAALAGKPQLIQIAGDERAVLPAGWMLAPNTRPKPEPLQVGTLTGLVDYMKLATAEAGSPKVIVIKGPDVVEVVGALEPEATLFRRATYLRASLDLVGAGPRFGEFMEAEPFIIMLQTAFVEGEGRFGLLNLVVSIKDSSVRETQDSGAAQTVTVKKGVAFSGEVTAQMVHKLSPFRTFREIDQPESKFILRMQSGSEQRPRLALFEAEGNAWKLTAIEGIKAKLRGELPDVAILA